MFVMKCYDKDEAQYEYEYKWGGSPLGTRKKIEHDFQGSFEKLEKQYFNGESSTYTEEQFLCTKSGEDGGKGSFQAALRLHYE